MKLATYSTVKNPSETKKGLEDKKAMRRAKNERLKEGKDADEEQKKLKKKGKKKKEFSKRMPMQKLALQKRIQTFLMRNVCH
jgi:hypothetical protein